MQKLLTLDGKGNTDNGFCYATHNEPTIDDSIVSKGIPKVGTFTDSINGLNRNNPILQKGTSATLRAEGVVLRQNSRPVKRSAVNQP
jgi:hypothetical protein